jgi:chemotaxis protein MotB
MAKRKIAHGHVNHERWMVSYADFVTLLFAFFVVMFATANSDKSKAAAMSEAVKEALSQSPRKAPPSAGQAPAANCKDREFKNPMKVLQEQLKEQIQKGEVEIFMEPRGLTISFKQAAVFDSGEADVKPTAIPAVTKVADAILALDNQIRLEGHTDNVPINNDRYRNNWELSSARSIAILQLLADRFHVPPTRMAVSGYADTAPIASNDSEEGRARNRRVDVIILNQVAAKSEPAKAILSK